ncbi:MAG: hypothetical protein ABJQ71_09420 [Roseibium sp.]
MTGNRQLFWIFLLLLVIIVAGALSPVLIVIASNLAANLAGCTFVAGKIEPCMIAGMDFGKHMGTVQHMPWLLFYTIPAGLIAFAVWLIGLGIVIYSRRKRRPEASCR